MPEFTPSICMDPHCHFKVQTSVYETIAIQPKKLTNRRINALKKAGYFSKHLFPFSAAAKDARRVAEAKAELAEQKRVTLRKLTDEYC